MKIAQGFASIIVISIVLIGLLVTFAPLPYYVGSDEFVCLSLECPKQGLNWGPSLYQRLQSKSETDDFDQTTSEIKEQRPEQVADWRTYINEELGFKFQYPTNWKIENNTASHFGLRTNRETMQNGTGDYTPGMAWLDVVISETNLSNTLDELVGVIKEGKIKVDEIEAVRLTGYEGIAGSVYFEKVLFEKEGKTFIIGIATQDQELKEAFVEEFNTILSTFKFIDSDHTPIEGRFCGGIAANLPANQCPEGYTCKLDSAHPDAGGTCTRM